MKIRRVVFEIQVAFAVSWLHTLRWAWHARARSVNAVMTLRGEADVPLLLTPNPPVRTTSPCLLLCSPVCVFSQVLLVAAGSIYSGPSLPVLHPRVQSNWDDWICRCKAWGRACGIPCTTLFHIRDLSSQDFGIRGDSWASSLCILRDSCGLVYNVHAQMPAVHVCTTSICLPSKFWHGPRQPSNLKLLLRWLWFRSRAVMAGIPALPRLPSPTPIQPTICHYLPLATSSNFVSGPPLLKPFCQIS